MNVYLVRHAIAFEPDPTAWPDDRERPLTPGGEKKFRRAVRGLQQLVPSVDLVLSSPLTRAWQTAAILAKDAGWPEPRRFDPLEPGRSPAEVLDGLQPHQGAAAMALVGHEPSLHELAAYFLTGDPGSGRLVLRKGGVVSLIFEHGLQPAGAELEWLVRPRILRALA
jgi:phosphohistidine phosphatase